MQINDEIKNGLIKSLTNRNKKQLPKMSCSIGESHNLHYQPMLKKYAYHRMLLCLLGRNKSNNLRREAFWLTIFFYERK